MIAFIFNLHLIASCVLSIHKYNEVLWLQMFDQTFKASIFLCVEKTNSLYGLY